MYPRPAARPANKECVVIRNRQVVDRVPAEARTRPRRQLLRLVLLPGQIGYLQSGTGPADDTRPDAHRTRLDPALALHKQRVFRRTSQRFSAARFDIVQLRGYPIIFVTANWSAKCMINASSSLTTSYAAASPQRISRSTLDD